MKMGSRRNAVWRSEWLVLTVFVALVSAMAGQPLLNVRFATDADVAKTGPAAIGHLTNDYWNLYSRDVPGTGGSKWRQSGVLQDMKWSDGRPSPVVLEVQNAAGAWFTDSQDPMMYSYLYPLSRIGSITMTFTALPPGTYDVYVYAHGQLDTENSEISVNSAGTQLGPLATTASPGWNTTNWQNGIQYVCFKNVGVVANQPLIVTSAPGKSGLAVINGIQLLQVVGSPCLPHRAAGVATVAYGFVVHIEVTDGGCGYTEPPLVVIKGGGGSGAAARAIVQDGVVTSIEVTDPGREYTSTPAVLIASPPHAPWLDISVSKVKVQAHVVLGRKYILESSRDFSTWSPLGDAFVANDEPVVFEVDVEENGRYLRVKEVP